MEGYLKNLLNDLGESDSSRIHIVDDNFNSSQSILIDQEGNEHRKRPSIQRAYSMDTSLIADSKFNDCDASDVYHLSPENNDTNYILNRKQLSARMERHRLSRWNASPSPKAWVTPTTRRSSFRTLSGSSTIELLESLASTTIDTPERALNKPQVKTVRGVDEEDNEPLREYDDNKMKTTSDTATTSKDDNVCMKNATFDRERTCSYRDFLNGGMDLSNQQIIFKASDWKMKSGEMQCMNNDMKRNKNKTKTTGRRLERGRRSKVDSMHAPPHVPIRRKSIDDIEAELASFILKERSPKAKVKLPSSLLELPYFSYSNHSV